MTRERRSAIIGAVVAVGRDGAGPAVDWVCEAAVDLLSLKGAGVSLFVEGDLRGIAGVSDPGIALMQELQLTLGEGPCVEAWASRSPVLESDLVSIGSVRWPMFSRAAIERGVQSVFAFPMALGAIRIGVLVLYREWAGALSPDELGDGLLLADVATEVVLSLQAGMHGAELHHLLAGEPPHWAEIHQATGMVSAQLRVSLDEAFVRLRAHAFAQELDLREVARAVVAGELRLDAA